MTEETKNKVMGKINEIKSNIETFISDVNVNDLKASVNLMMKDAQNDFNKLINKDIDLLKKKLQKEKQDFESKAKTFLDGHKKEIASLQAKVEKLIKVTQKLSKKSSKNPSKASEAGSKKKVLKKVAKAKPAAGFKKATRKTTSR
jgi:hypothetical protein